MPGIPSIGHGSVGPVNRATGVSPPNGKLPQHEQNGQAGDRVELSAHATLLNRLLHMPDVRTELIEKVRQAIADGTYETPEKIDAAVAKLLEEELV
jgi:negative regulator of flagellin synthesis FlgM